MEEFTLWIKSLDTNSSSVKDNTPRRCVGFRLVPGAKAAHGSEVFLGRCLAWFRYLRWLKDARKFSVARSHHSPTPFLPLPPKKRNSSQEKKNDPAITMIYVGGEVCCGGVMVMKKCSPSGPQRDCCQPRKGSLKENKPLKQKVWQSAA